MRIFFGVSGPPLPHIPLSVQECSESVVSPSGKGLCAPLFGFFEDTMDGSLAGAGQNPNPPVVAPCVGHDTVPWFLGELASGISRHFFFVACKSQHPGSLTRLGDRRRGGLGCSFVLAMTGLLFAGKP